MGRNAQVNVELFVRPFPTFDPTHDNVASFFFWMCCARFKSGVLAVHSLLQDKRTKKMASLVSKDSFVNQLSIEDLIDQEGSCG